MSHQISANNIYTASGRKAASRSGLYHNTNIFRIAGLMPQSLQPQTPVTVATVGWCHKSGERATSCARTMSLLLQSRDLGRRAARFVRSALTVATQNDGDFVEVILLYTSFRALLSAHTEISTENVLETGERFPNSREFLYANSRIIRCSVQATNASSSDLINSNPSFKHLPMTSPEFKQNNARLHDTVSWTLFYVQRADDILYQT